MNISFGLLTNSEMLSNGAIDSLFALHIDSQPLEYQKTGIMVKYMSELKRRGLLSKEIYDKLGREFENRVGKNFDVALHEYLAAGTLAYSMGKPKSRRSRRTRRSARRTRRARNK